MGTIGGSSLEEFEADAPFVVLDEEPAVLAQGFGASIISFLLEAVGYIPTLGPDQTLDVALNIKQLCGLIQFAGALIMFISLAVIYNLDKKTVAKMEQSLGRSNLDVVGEASGDD